MTCALEEGVSLTVEIAGEKLVLFPERGLFWERGSTLLISDWHIGKADTFRAAGIGVPDGDLEEELARLESMVQQTAAAEILVLGDLIHARDSLRGGAIGRVGRWIEENGIQISMVTGNHDRSAGVDRTPLAGIDGFGASLARAPFVFQHEPEPSEQGYALAGHLHPVIRMREGKGGGLRAPCFWFGSRVGVLPAFGGFTGGHGIDPEEGDRVYVLGGGDVIEITA